MANILNIDTSTDVCSVALTSEGGVVQHFEDYKGQNHAQVLSSFIEKSLSEAYSHGLKLDAVAVSIGPGSYTGLRIGLSEAKGLCYGLDIPLIGINTLQILTVSVMFNNMDADDDDYLFVPMIDARRMEVFTGVYDLALNEIMKPQAKILARDSFSDLLDENKKLAFFGNGAKKAVELIKHPGIKYIPGIKPLATDMLALSERAYRSNDFLDLAYSTPQYLKDFQATTPRGKK